MEKAALPLFYAAFFESGLHTLMNVGLQADTAAIINNFEIWHYLRKNNAGINYITMRAMTMLFCRAKYVLVVKRMKTNDYSIV